MTYITALTIILCSVLNYWIFQQDGLPYSISGAVVGTILYSGVLLVAAIKLKTFENGAVLLIAIYSASYNFLDSFNAPGVSWVALIASIMITGYVVLVLSWTQTQVEN